MPHSQERFAEGDYSSSRKFKNLECRFHSYTMKSPGPKKADFLKTFTHSFIGKLRCRRKESSRGSDECLQSHSVPFEISNMRQALKSPLAMSPELAPPKLSQGRKRLIRSTSAPRARTNGPMSNLRVNESPLVELTRTRMTSAPAGSLPY